MRAAWMGAAARLLLNDRRSASSLTLDRRFLSGTDWKRSQSMGKIYHPMFFGVNETFFHFAKRMRQAWA